MQPVAWRLSWQDYRQHVPGVGMTRPKLAKLDFPTREDAEKARRDNLTADERVVSCITPVFLKPHKKTVAADWAGFGIHLPAQRKQLTD